MSTEIFLEINKINGIVVQIISHESLTQLEVKYIGTAVEPRLILFSF